LYALLIVLLHPKHFYHLVAEVVDHLHGDSTRFWFLERTGRIAVERRPGVFVVVGVDQPAGDAFGSVAVDFAGVRMKNVDAGVFRSSAMSGRLTVPNSGPMKVAARLPS